MTLEQRVSFPDEKDQIEEVGPDVRKKSFLFRFVHSNGIEERYLAVDVSCDPLDQMGMVEIIQNGERLKFPLRDPNRILPFTIKSDDGKKEGTVTWRYIPPKSSFTPQLNRTAPEGY